MRKKWTAKSKVDESVLHFREKRKWQIALRRYVLQKNKSSLYAPYFGLGIEKFREWMGLQFDETMNWENFSTVWQFDHIVPVAYFDFNKEADLRLCWNFINIRAEKSKGNKDRSNSIDVIAAKKYFQVLYQKTGYGLCKEMIDKIASIEESEIVSNIYVESFINSNKDYIEALRTLTPEDFVKLNTGTELKSILYEKEFLKRWS